MRTIIGAPSLDPIWLKRALVNEDSGTLWRLSSSPVVQAASVNNANSETNGFKMRVKMFRKAMLHN
jgi:hypothetical protein